MRVAVHAPSVRPGGRLERALLGLHARGHELSVSGRPAPGSALVRVGEQRRHTGRHDADVAVGGPSAGGALLLAALTGARAVVLELEAGPHRAWGPLVRWGWSVLGAHGIVPESEVTQFLGAVPEGEHERFAIWPTGHEGGEPSTHPDTAVLERACERALARRSAGPGRAALFVDRDGTLIEERHHLADPDGVTLVPGAAEALRAARTQGHPVVVISNQAGVGRGLFPESRVHEVMARVRVLLRAEGVELDAVRHCPHAPDAGCDCRKPGTRLLREAADDLRVSLRDSAMVGDKWIDVEAGRAAGGAGVLVLTGHGAEEARLERAPGEGADAVCPDLPAAVRWFLARSAG